ncbi:MAG: hypothetical protein ACMG6E_01035 [Candidatus Roizmanbacteria bacterium]
MVYALDINQSTFAPARFSTIGSFLSVLLPAVLLMAGFVFLGITIWASYLVIQAKGEKKNLEDAQRMFKYSLLGIIIVSVAYLLTKVLGVIGNVNFGL